MWLENPTNRRDASWHYVVDENIIIQSIPEAEEAWHAGHSYGNKHSIGIEICESGDRRKTLENAAEFIGLYLKGFGWGRQVIAKLIEGGKFADVHRLNLSEDMIRTFVILYR